MGTFFYPFKRYRETMVLDTEKHLLHNTQENYNKIICKIKLKSTTSSSKKVFLF